MPPVLYRGEAAAEVGGGEVPAGGGLGADGPPESFGAMCLSFVGGVSLVFYLHVEDRRPLHCFRRMKQVFQ